MEESRHMVSINVRTAQEKPIGLTGEMFRRALIDSFVKLNPRLMVRNPVMFVVEVGSVLTTALWIQALSGTGEAPAWYIGGVSLWLWFTVLFANFSEALAEGRGKAQAEALRRARKDTTAKRLRAPRHGSAFEIVASSSLQQRRCVSRRGGRYHSCRR